MSPDAPTGMSRDGFAGVQYPAELTFDIIGKAVLPCR
jgi:hypothetical protein